MKAIKIDVEKQQVYEVDIDGSIKDLHKFISCDCFAGVYRRSNGDYLFVDDEGLLKDTPIGAFAVNEYAQPLSGNGLFVGTGPEGESIDVKSTVQEIAAITRFIPVQLLKGVPTEPVFISMTDAEFAHFFKTGELPQTKTYDLNKN